MNLKAGPHGIGYTPIRMELAIYLSLAVIIAFVAIDAIARLDERRPARRDPRDESTISTQKIVVDLSRRG